MIRELTPFCAAAVVTMAPTVLSGFGSLLYTALASASVAAAAPTPLTNAPGSCSPLFRPVSTPMDNEDILPKFLAAVGDEII